MNSIFKNRGRKGQASQMSLIGFVLFALVILIGFGVANFFTADIFNNLNNDLQNDTTMSNLSKQTVSDLNTSYPKIFDGLSLFILVGLWIGGLIAAFYSDVNPVFFVVFIVVMVFILVSAGLLSNYWEDITSDASMSGTLANFPITNWIMTNYMLVFLIILFSSLIVSFMKSRSVI